MSEGRFLRFRSIPAAVFSGSLVAGCGVTMAGPGSVTVISEPTGNAEAGLLSVPGCVNAYPVSTGNGGQDTCREKLLAETGQEIYGRA